MKIGCPCGGVIADNSDCIPYKATFVADRDHDDMLDEIVRVATSHAERLVASTSGDSPLSSSDHLWIDISTAIWKYSRAMYQCTGCGRLAIDDSKNNVYVSYFSPDNPNQTRFFLNSIHGAQWKGHLTASWSGSDEVGSVWWDVGEGDRGWERFADWEAVESRYRTLFDIKQRAGLLRSAFLRKNDTILHSWDTDAA
jgi:hypothetical protein